MNVGFVHSHRFTEFQGDVYTTGSLPYGAWSRYLHHFESLVVMARHDSIQTPASNMDISSGPRVSFVWLPDLNRPVAYNEQRRRTALLFREQLAKIHALIVRLSGHGWLAAAEAERRGIPWAVEVVGDAWDALWNYGSLAGKLYAPIAWWQARKWIGRAPFAIYVTQEYLQRRYPCNGVTAYASNVELLPVSASVFDQRKNGFTYSHAYCKATIKCGLIGSLFTRHKGLHVALRALQRLRAQGNDIHLHVLGNGRTDPWKSMAHTLGVPDLLHLDGVLPRGEPVMRWLDSLDFYIQPSFQEGLPRALIEAMSRGLPALGSTAGGIPELLPPECMHRPGDDRKLTKDMVRMVRDTEWRKGLARRNFIEAKNYYSDKVSTRRAEFLAEFAAHASQSGRAQFAQPHGRR